MKQRVIALVTTVLVLGALALLSAPPVEASSVTLNYQAMLTTPAGDAVPDGSYQVLFRIMDDSLTGNELWREVHPAVTTSNGLFSVLLGSITPLDQSVFNTQPLWLEIDIGADPPISPRTLLTSVPSAATAQELDGSVQTQPGIIAIMPPDPFLPNDTLPHVQLIADSASAKLKLMPPDPCNQMGGGSNGGGIDMGVGWNTDSFFDIMYSLDCPPDTSNGIKMLVDSTAAKLLLQHHQDSSSLSLSVDQHPMIDLQEPAKAALNLGIDPNEGGIIIVNNLPSPGQALQAGDTMRVKLKANSAEAALSVQQAPGDGSHGAEVAISSAVSTGATLKMFNPQPEPPGEPILVVGGGTVGTGASIRMFNPQPEPPGEPILEMNSGAGEGASINMFNPKVGVMSRAKKALTDTLVQVAADSATGGRVVIRNPVTGLSSVRTGEQLSFNSPAGGTSVTINGSGDSYFVNSKLGLGTYTPGNILTVVQSSPTDPIADAWTTYSSRRWKKNIKPMKGALGKVEKLRGVTFDWKADGKHDIGLIAEEVGQVVPEVVAYEENGVDAKSVDYARLVALLIQAVKEQQETITGLQRKANQVETLKAQVNRLQRLVETVLAEKTDFHREHDDLAMK